VTAVAGDITLPALGLGASTARQLQSEVHFILHTAADIRLEVDIQSALTANYEGTAAVLQLAQGCTRLRALVHTSSCFVNMNQPRSSVVDSRIYPLRLGDRVVSCQEVVQVGQGLPLEKLPAQLGCGWQPQWPAIPSCLRCTDGLCFMPAACVPGRVLGLRGEARFGMCQSSSLPP
jgi:hypothetical protein